MITLFPIAFWSDKDRSGRSGTSWFFACTATRSHPYAAAIMAQEVYETRFKTVRALVIAALLIAIAAGVAWKAGRSPTAIDIAAVVVFALAIGMLFTGLYPPWQRELELRGQAVECAVRDEHYLHSFAKAMNEAADQLTRYDQFDGWERSKIQSALWLRWRDHADGWVERNRAMIARAIEQSRA